jgi:hypothetical protein
MSKLFDSVNRRALTVYLSVMSLLLAAVSGVGAQTPVPPDFTANITDSVTTLGTQLGIVIAAVVGLGAAMIAFRKGWSLIRRMAG